MPDKRVDQYGTITPTGNEYVLIQNPSTLAYQKALVSSISGTGGSGAVTSVAGKTGAVTLTSTDVGLSNVDNTSDVNKPVSTAQATALAAKEPTITAGTSVQYYRGDKTMQTLNQDAVPSGTTNKAYTATEQTKLAAITGTNTGDQTTITGNAGTATTLQTARTIGTLTGDVTSAGSSFNGSANNTNATVVGKINGVALSGLATGILKNTTTTGVPSIAVAADFPTLNQNTTGTASTITGSITESQVTNLTTDLAAKQVNLVSGTNIKTINGNSLLGSGDITITGGSGGSSTLAGDTDVLITSPANNDVLTYDLASSKWKNATAGTTTVPDTTTTTKGIIQLAGDLAGTATAPTVPGLANKAAKGANSDITSLSGLTTALTVAQGGTGAATLTGIVKGNGTGAMTAVTAPTGTIVGTTDTQTLTNKTLDNTNITTVKATNLTIQDSTDTTKQAKFDASGITTATTRTYTLPNATDTLVGRTTTDTLSNKTLDNTTVETIKAANLTIQDATTTTKQAKFDASAITAATTRTYTLPDATGTVALTSSNITGTAAGLSANITESQVTNLTTDLAAKATDTAVVHLANAEAISGVKTFNSGSLVLKGATAGTTTLNATATALGTLTLPATTDTLVALTTTDTLTNKTLTSPTINTPIITQSVTTQTTTATLAVGSSAIQYANATTAAFTITLPTTITAGISFTIVKTDSSANAVTVAGTINGAVNYVLSTQWSYIQVVSTTTSGTWYIIDNSTASTATNVTGTVAIANGGTGVATLPSGLLKGAGTGAITAITAPTGAIVGTTDTQTLTNKTLTTPSITGAAAVAATPATGVGTLFGVGTATVRPHFINSSGTDETLVTSTTVDWTAWTPTITATTGTFTSVTPSNARYVLVGKTLFWTLSITITTVGTAASAIIFTLPANALTTSGHIGTGREDALTGNMASVRLNSASQAGVLAYNNASLIGAGALVNLSGFYPIP